MIIKFNEKEEYVYHYNIIKAWEITPEEIVKNKLYMLLPIIISNKKKYENKSKEEMLEFYKTVMDLSFKEQNESDMEVILDTLDYIFAGFVKRTINNEQEQKEVLDMSTALKMKSFSELKNEYIAQVKSEGIEQGIKQGIKQGIDNNSMDIAQRMLKANFPVEQISELTGLSLSDVEKLVAE